MAQKTRQELKAIWSDGVRLNQALFNELFDSLYTKIDEPIIFDTFITGATLSGNTLILTRNDDVEIEQDLSSLTLPDYYVTGATLSGNTLILSRNDDVEIEQDLSGLVLPDYYVTGATLDGNFLVLTRNDGVRISQDLSGLVLPDYYVTGTTLSGNTLILTRNDGVEIEQDLSSLVLPDYYVTGVTVDGSYIILTRNDDVRISQDLSGLVLPDYYVTGTTLSGNTLILTRNDDVEIEQDLSSLVLDEIYESGVTFNSISDTYPYMLTIEKTNNVNATVSLSSLANDAYGLSGVYSAATGTVTFTNTTGDTFDVTGFLTGYTDVYINGMSFSGSTLTINRENTSGLTQAITFSNPTYLYYSLSANTNDISLSGNDIIEIGMDDYSYSALTFSNPLQKDYTLLFKHVYVGYPPFSLPSIKNYSFTFNSFVEDTTFYTNLGSAFNSDVYSVAVQSDGKILVGGQFATLNGTTRNRLVRLNADGTHDTAFYTNLGTAFNSNVKSIVVQSDGKILVGGQFSTGTLGGTRNRLVRLNANGTQDTTFYTNLGSAFNSDVYSVAVQSDGKILVGGQFATLNGTTRNRLVRLNADGTHDTAFYTNLGTAFNSNVKSIVVQSDGKILVGGQFTTLNGVTRNYLVRLNADGTEDTDFYTNLSGGFGNTVWSIAVQSDGKILVGGQFTALNGTTRNRLVRLNADGTEDTTFYTNLGGGFDSELYYIAVQSDGKILVGGYFTALNGTTRNRLVRLNADGTEDTDFYSGLGTAFKDIVYSVAVQSDGKILVGGNFTTLNGTTRNRLVRLNADGTILDGVEYSAFKILYASNNYIQLNN